MARKPKTVDKKETHESTSRTSKRKLNVETEPARTPTRSSKHSKTAVTYNEQSAEEVDEPVENSSPSIAKRSAKAKQNGTTEVEVDTVKDEASSELVSSGVNGSAKSKKTVKRVKTEVAAESKDEAADLPTKKAKAVAKRKSATAAEDDPDSDAAPATNGETPRKKRKTKEEKEAEMLPLAARTQGLKMFVGAHVSMSKGIENSVKNAHQIGGNAFALFLKSQRKWENPPLQDANREAFIKLAGEQETKYDTRQHVLPHGSYLVNLAIEDKDRSKQAYDAFLDDLQRCEKLGIKLYNFHPGATGGSDIEDATRRIADHLNKALAATEMVMPVLENMAGRGTVVGSRWSELASIISKIKPEFADRIGVCIDTCHTFAAGYDLRTPESFKATLADFDKVVGMKYLKALHLNDSKAPFDSQKDLHQNIGLGFLGLRAFHNVMNEPRFENLPLILETPCEKPDPNDKTGKKTLEDKTVWAREIKLLESLIGMDPEGAEFKKLEKELADKGKAEREKHQKSYDEKQKKLEKQEKGQKSLKDMMGGGAKGKPKKGKRDGNVSDQDDEA